MAYHPLQSSGPYPRGEREALRPLREHQAFITVFIVSAMLSALALTYIYSERYRTETTIFFKTSDVTRLNTHTTEALGSPSPSAEFKIITETIRELANTDAVLRRVVTDLGLDVREPKELSGPWYVRYLKELKYGLSDFAANGLMLLKFGRIVEEDPAAAAITRLRKQVKVSNYDSYLSTVQVTAETPQRAAAIADDFAAVLGDVLRHADALSSDKRSVELVALRDERRREIERIETKMQDLLVRNRVASIKDELEKITDRASKLQQQRADALADLRQRDAEVAMLAGKLHLSGPPAPTRDDDRPITRQPSRITPEDYAKLTTKKLDAEVEGAGLRARLEAFDRAYTELVPHLRALNETQAVYDLLAAELASAKRDFAALTDAVQELVIRVTSGQGELLVQAKAEIPQAPVSPIKMYHVLAAGVLAVLTAVGFAYVLDYFKIRLFLPPGSGLPRRQLDPKSALARSPQTTAPVIPD